MRKILISAIIPAILFLGFSFDPSRAEDSTELTPYGSAAIGELAGCLRTSTSLDVYYLIDASLSLKETDPRNERAKIISQDLARWADIGSALPGLSINVAGSKFNATTSYLSGWQSLTANSANSVAKSFTSTIDNNHLGNYTNWRVGIEKAHAELSKRISTCKVMIWFTDGGLWSAEPRIASLKDLAYLCGPANSNDVTRESSGDGLMAQVRRSGIHVFGVMLKDSDATKGDSQEKRNEESYYSSLMKPMVEESGSIPAVPGHKAADMKCGENLSGEDRSYATGAFLQGASAADVAFKFMKIPALVAGGTAEACHKNGSFAVDPGIGKIEFQTDATSWKILNAKGEVFATSKEVSGINTTTKLEIPDLNESEEWKFIYSGGSGICSLYVYPEIYLELHDKALVTGRESSITGQFFGSLTSHEKIDFSIYKNVSLQATVNNAPQSANLVQKTGSFEIANYTPPTDKTEIAVAATLKLETENYVLNPVSFRLSSPVASAAGLPEVSKIQFNSSLDGARGKAVAKASIKAPTGSLGESWICFKQPKVIADDQSGFGGKSTNRTKTWSWSYSGLDAKNCVRFTVGTNRDQEVSFAVSNKVQANAESQALFDYEIYANNLNLKDSQTATFETREQTSQITFWIWFVLSLLLGFAIPVLVLGYLNYLNAAFQTDGLYRAEIPVEYDPNSKRFNVVDFDAFDFDSAIRFFNAANYPSSKTKSLIDPPQAYSSGVHRILHSPRIQLTARNSWLKPMRGPIFTSKPIDGFTTISASGGKLGKTGEQVLTGSRLSKFAYLVFDSGEITSAAQSKSVAKGVLIVIAGEAIRRGDFAGVHDAINSGSLNTKLQDLYTELEKVPQASSSGLASQSRNEIESFLSSGNDGDELNFGGSPSSGDSSPKKQQNNNTEPPTDLDFS